MRDRALIPWREVSSWACQACGNCCVGYRVPLKMDEYVRVNNLYGPSVMEYGVGKAYLKLRSDNRRCVFQKPLMDRWICTLQEIKPTACRLFPFRIHKEPVYKRGDNSAIRFRGKTYHVYMNPDCHGVIPGQPIPRFANQIIPEILGIGIGLAQKQKYTTSKHIHWRPT